MLLILAALFLCLIIAVVLYGRRNYRTLENCGFPVIPPTLFLGSDPYFYKEVPHLKDIERFKKYGPIWGLYLGQTPQVLISSPELIRQILVKDFDHFSNRRDIDMGSPLLNEILDYLPGEKWKTVRAMLSPMFTTSKLKSMANVMAAHAEEYMRDLKEECRGNNGRVNYDCKLRITAWLIDTFAQSTLGIELENRKDPNNALALAFRKMMGEDTVYGPLYSLAMTFPFLNAFAPTFDDSYTKLLETTFRHILESRRDRREAKATDFVDLLNDIMDKVGSEEFRNLGITDVTVISQFMNLFIGGYETSSTTLSHFLYYMAQNPDIQETLFQEVASKFSDSGITNHDSIKEENTPYLTACLNESLRLAPPVKIERICTKDWTHGDIRIKKGTEVYVAMWAVQRNPEHYPDPDDFKQERFLPDNKPLLDPYAFVAFDHGPRRCIGMRFAYDSMKTLLIHLVLNFRVEFRSDTVLNYKKGSSLLVNFDPLYLDFVPRNVDK